MLHYFTLPVAVIYGILSVESGAHIERADLARFLLDTDGGAVPSSIASLFSEGEGEEELQPTLLFPPTAHIAAQCEKRASKHSKYRAVLCRVVSRYCYMLLPGNI